jgi:hypothetical protein
MAIGKRKTGDSIGKLTWEFGAGAFVAEDRVYADGEWQNKQTNIANSEFRAVVDLANTETGWIAFLKGEGLNAVLAKIGHDYGARPSDDHHEGLRLVMKMDESLGGGVREFITTSVSLWGEIDKLHDAFLAGHKKHEGCLPAVDVAATREEQGRTCKLRVPVFKIAGWVPRPPELPEAGLPLVRRAKKKGDNGASTTTGSEYERPKPQDDMKDAIPF